MLRTGNTFINGPIIAALPFVVFIVAGNQRHVVSGPVMREHNPGIMRIPWGITRTRSRSVTGQGLVRDSISQS
jgi:hypothetical protein